MDEFIGLICLAFWGLVAMALVKYVFGWGIW